jgi:phosphoribosylformylglycinamidine synthase subunit PurS
MKFVAQIDVMPLKEILDPQGKAVKLGLNNLGISSVQDVRIGKHISLQIEAGSENEAKEKAELACKKLLCNPIMEDFSFSIQKSE